MITRPKKRLGQNFLIDDNIRKKIISNLNLASSDVVLEIGAGKGELTGLIAQIVKTVYALEIDPALCEHLEIKFKNQPNVKIINKDILKFDIDKKFSRRHERIKVFGNIPYYISTPIIEKLIESRKVIRDIFIMVQKEYALRVRASSGNKEYGSFSCFVQYYLEPAVLFHIKKTSFNPQPKVDSSFMRLAILQNPKVQALNEGFFFKLIRASFNKRRKTLRNSLKDLVPRKKLDDFFAKYGIEENVRPEKLSLSDFANLSNIV